MAYLVPTVTGKVRTGPDPKRDKEIGELRVTLTKNTETADEDGTRLQFPRVDLRPKIEVFRDGNLVAFGQVSASSIADGVEEFFAERGRSGAGGE